MQPRLHSFVKYIPFDWCWSGANKKGTRHNQQCQGNSLFIVNGGKAFFLETIKGSTATELSAQMYSVLLFGAVTMPVIHCAVCQQRQISNVLNYFSFVTLTQPVLIHFRPSLGIHSNHKSIDVNPIFNLLLVLFGLHHRLLKIRT